MLHPLRGAIGRLAAALVAIATIAAPPVTARTLPIAGNVPTFGYNQRYLEASNAFRLPSDWETASAQFINLNDKKLGDLGTTPTTAPLSVFTGSLAGTVLTVSSVTSGALPTTSAPVAVYNNGAYLGKISGNANVNANGCGSSTPCTGNGGAGTYYVADAAALASTPSLTTGYVWSATFGFTRRAFFTSWTPTLSKFLFSYRTQQVQGIDTGLTSWTILRAEINNNGAIIPMMLNGAPVSRTNPLVLTAQNPDVWLSPLYDPPGNAALFFDTWDQVQGGVGSARPGGILTPRTDLGEASKNAQVPFDTAAAPTSGASSFAIYIGPAMYVAVPPVGTTPAVVGLATDSLEDQTAYIVPGACDWGWLRAALCSTTGGRINNIAFSRYSSAGSVLFGPPVGGYGAASAGSGPYVPILPWIEARMGDLGQQGYPFNRFLYEHFRNEGGNQSLAQGYQIAGHDRAVARTPGLKWYGMTPLPYTSSTDGWATEGNQTDAYGGTTRSAQVSWVRSNEGGMAQGYIDPANYLQSLTANGINTNVWPATSRTGTLMTATSAKTTSLSLSFAPNIGDCITLEPGAAGQDVAGMVTAVSGAASPYAVTLNSATTVASHPMLSSVYARSVQDGTHECHATMTVMAGYVAGSAWKTAL